MYFRKAKHKKRSAPKISQSSTLHFNSNFPSQVVDLKYKNGVASLAINEIFPEDEGVYSLKAINSQGETETKCKVTVKGT